jgi:hypothetical protein
MEQEIPMDMISCHHQLIDGTVQLRVLCIPLIGTHGEWDIMRLTLADAMLGTYEAEEFA